MPCRDDRDNVKTIIEYAESPDSKKRRDKLARMLCSTMKVVENINAMANIPQEVKDWWKKHKKEDELRLRKQRRKTKEETVRLQALKKLTSSERKVLGL